MARDNKLERGENGGNETNLPNLSESKKSTKAVYLNFKSAKKCSGNHNSSGGNIKKGAKASKSSNYLTLGAKNPFNFLWHAFT